MQLGASFSHRHFRYLGLDPIKALNEFMSFGFSWIRLGCYWDEIEEDQGKFTFDYLDQLIDICAKNNLNVVLTVGMKAPRWPEYYLPAWHSPTPKSEFVLPFISSCISHYQDQPAIKVWQVENEPLDKSGPKKWSISLGQLSSEVNLVRQLDPARKILINLWGNQLFQHKNFTAATDLADIVGLNLYPKVPNRAGNRYSGPKDSTVKIQHLCQQIKLKGKDVWITEIQSEPWETDLKLVNEAFPPSFLPQDLSSNLNYAKSLDPDLILLWGFEWWYSQKAIGRHDYWDQAIMATK